MNNDLEQELRDGSLQAVELTDLEIIEMNNVYSRASGVKCLAVLDFVLAIFSMLALLNAGANTWFIGVLSILILMGYIGAKTYNSCLLNGYIMYLVIEIIGYMLMVYQYSGFIILLILVDFYFIQYVYKLQSAINKLPLTSLVMLRSGYKPVTEIRYYWF